MYYYNQHSPSDASSYAYIVMSHRNPPEEVCLSAQKLDAWAKKISARYRRREFIFAKRTVSFDIGKHDCQGQSEEERFLAKETIAQLLASLTDCQLEAIKLLYFEEKSYKEAADELGIEVSSVISREKNALKRMLIAYESDGVTPPRNNHANNKRRAKK